MIKIVFNYLEPIWLGNDNKPSIRRILALAFSIDLIMNTSYVIRRWEIGQSFADAAFILGGEAALIAALLSLTTYQTIMNSSANKDKEIIDP